MLLEGKTVVVSGVGPGLGREIAVAAAREGANVVIGARTEANLSAAANEVDPSGERVAYAVTDIMDADGCRRLADTAAQRFGSLDALVNCAAKDTLFGGLEDADFDEWHETIDTNVFGTLQMTKAAVPHLKRQGGSIVFVGAQAMYKPQVMQMAYAASKAALVSASYYLAVELGPYGIRVNTVVPSWMWGPPVEGYVNTTAGEQGVSPEEIVAGITANMPLRKIPSDGDIAETIVFFASDRARMITGQTLLVNAGEHMR